jgi:cell division protein FtsB
MKGPRGNQIEGLDVGPHIRKHLREKRISHAVLARRLKRNQSVVKRMLYNSSIQTYLVWELSQALGHNFFTDLAQQLDQTTEGKLQQQQTELEELKKEHERLKEEHAYLKKAIDLLSRKG